MTSLRVARSLATALWAASVIALALALVGRPIQGSLSWLGSSAAVGIDVDVVRALLLCLVTGVGTVVAWYSSRNLTGQPRLGRFAFLELGVVVSLGLAVVTTSLPVLAVAWTLASLAISGLVGHVDAPQSRLAARQVRARLLVGDLLLWGGVVTIGTGLGTWTITGLPGAVATGSAAAITVAAALVVGAGIVRSALVPAHRWLPETASAPSPVSALLHAGVVNGVGVLALLMWPLMEAAGSVRLALVVIGLATAVIATAQMRTRVDVKGRLAASTSSQMGYLAIQVGLGIPAAALAHIVGHGVWKAAQFLGAGDAIARVRTADLRPTRPLRPVAVIGGVLLALAVGAAASFATLGSLPALSAPAELLPVVVALGITAVSLLTVMRTPSAAVVRLLGAAVVLLGAAAYLIGLRWLTLLVEPELGLPAGWSAPDALLTATVVAIVIAVGLAGLLIDGRARSGGLGSLARRTARGSLRPLTIRERLTARPRTLVAVGPVAPRDADRARGVVAESATGLARLYPLTSFVASNPLAGLEDHGIDEATALAVDLWQVEAGPSAAALRRAVEDGRVADADVDAVVAESVPSVTRDVAGRSVSLPDVARRLLMEDDASEARVHDVMAALRAAGVRSQRRLQTPMDAKAVPAPVQDRARELGHHMCARSLGQPAWPGADGPWRELQASADALDTLLGVRGAGAVVSALPADAASALAAVLDGLAVDPADRPLLIGRLLARDPGWPGHLLWRQRHDDLGETAGLPSAAGSAPSELLVQVAAMRLAIDVLVADAFARAQSLPALRGSDLVTYDAPADIARMLAVVAPDVAGDDVTGDDVRAWADLLLPLSGGRLSLLRAQALERAFRLPLVSSISSGAQVPSGDARRVSTAAQLVMCIDVRSERLRRSLEARGPWETFGAAGFFGLPVCYTSPRGLTTERAPALLRPTVGAIDVAPERTGLPGAIDALTRSVRAVERTPGLVFGWAEAVGWVLAPWVLARTVWPASMRAVMNAAAGRGDVAPRAHLELDAPADQRVEAAAGFLLSTGLVEFAPVVVLCGHGATVTNNPHVAAYDCGACGGSAGDVSARVMVDVLNDPFVRAGLRDQGIAIPDDTVFVAALHDTTTDSLHVLDDSVATGSAAQVLASLVSDVDEAAVTVRAERVALLPDAPSTAGAKARARVVRDRAADWSQPRPEWGLAGAAAIVVGPRSLTRGIDLDGRVFLQSYRADIDPDGAVLEQLLAAPVVVAQWITSQYWASTVDPVHFGAGDKTTHNIVGDGATISAVVTGPRGDLRLGLPWQAVSPAAPAIDAAGDPWSVSTRHQPQRLLVIVHAEQATIDAAIERQPGVAQLIRGSWITLCAIDPRSGAAHQRMTDGTWVQVDGPGPEASTTSTWAMTG